MQICRIACDPVYSGIWEINVRMVSGRRGRQLRIFWNEQGFQYFKQNFKANQAGKQKTKETTYVRLVSFVNSILVLLPLWYS